MSGEKRAPFSRKGVFRKGTGLRSPVIGRTQMSVCRVESPVIWKRMYFPSGDQSLTYLSAPPKSVRSSSTAEPEVFLIYRSKWDFRFELKTMLLSSGDQRGPKSACGSKVNLVWMPLAIS